MMKSFTCLGALLGLAMAMPLHALELVRNHRTEHLIVIGTNDPYHRFAASEFREIMRRSTGVDFKTVRSGSPEAAKAPKRILIGDSPELRALLGQDTVNQLKTDESLVTAKGQDLAIVGGGNNGTAYGVYHFLEAILGFRQFSDDPDGERIIPHANVTFPDKDLRRKPAFPFSRHLYMIYLYKPDAALYIYRNGGSPMSGFSKQNKMKGKILSDHQSWDSGHGFSLYITPKRYINYYPWDEPQDFFATHPEYFSLNQEGKRTTRMQLCFSNPELRKAFTKRILERARRVGGKGVLTIGANDVPGSFCHCPACQKLERKYESLGGPLYDYILELCPIVAKAYPDILISTLAYRRKQSQTPPKHIAKMPANWICDFAPVDDDQGQSIAGPRNLVTLQDLAHWNSIADTITYWYYLCITSAPFGLVERLSRDMKLMFEYGVDGVGVCGIGSPGVYSLQEYLLLRLMLDPYQDLWPLVEEYTQHFYGKAAPLVNTYFRELDQVWNEPQKYIGLYGPGADIMTYTPQRLLRWQALFARMETLLKDSPRERKYLARVRWDVDMLTLDHFATIAKQIPNHGLDLEAIIGRMRKTELETYHRGLINNAENAFLRCKAVNKPTPAPLDKLPPNQVIQLPQCGGKYNYVDPDAVCGQAKSQPLADGQIAKQGKKISFDIYDAAEKKMLKNGSIDVSKCTPGKYQLYFITKTRIPRGGLIAMDSWWGICTSLSAYYPEGNEFKEFEIWGTIKMVGPSFDPKSSEKKDRVILDRLFLVDRNPTTP